MKYGKIKKKLFALGLAGVMIFSAGSVFANRDVEHLIGKYPHSSEVESEQYSVTKEVHYDVEQVAGEAIESLKKIGGIPREKLPTIVYFGGGGLVGYTYYLGGYMVEAEKKITDAINAYAQTPEGKAEIKKYPYKYIEYTNGHMLNATKKLAQLQVESTKEHIQSCFSDGISSDNIEQAVEFTTMMRDLDTILFTLEGFAQIADGIYQIEVEVAKFKGEPIPEKPQLPKPEEEKPEDDKTPDPEEDNSGGEDFKDIQSHWARTQIRNLTALGVITGYEDGTFRPNENITREEASAILARVLGEQEATGKSGLSDIQGLWSEKSITMLEKANIVTGTPDGKFLPKKNISRAEFSVMVARLIKQKGIDNNNLDKSFPDTDSHWASTEIKELASYGFITGYPNGTFGPDNNITRGEVAKIISDAIAVENLQ